MAEQYLPKEREPMNANTFHAELNRLKLEATLSYLSPLSREYSSQARKWLTRVAELLGRVIASGVRLDHSFASELVAYKDRLLADQHSLSTQMREEQEAHKFIGRLQDELMATEAIAA